MRIEYHREACGPAINVKAHNLHRDVPDGAHGTDAQQERAYAIVSEDWWQRASEIAQAMALRDLRAAFDMEPQR